MHLDGVNTQKKGVGALMMLLQPYVVRQFYLLQIPVTVIVQDLARSHYRTCGARNKPRGGMLYRRYRTRDDADGCDSADGCAGPHDYGTL